MRENIQTIENIQIEENNSVKNKASFSARRLAGSVIGIVIIGIGCAIFKQSMLGNDPITAMNLRLAEIFNIPFAIWNLVPNVLFLIIQIIFGRKYIGLGTIINGGFIGYVISFFAGLLVNTFGEPSSLPIQIAWVLIGVIVTSLGISFYQESNMGIGPYDAVSLIMHDKLKLPYFGCRLFTDAVCTVVAFCTGGLIGLGTLVSTFGFGPFISFFNKHISKKWIY
ncbi:MAG: DUF6198 family protein [Lachnospiraceae bacterium]|nr:DUF6198 family protein [Lachnospiraceae bacterium]